MLLDVERGAINLQPIRLKRLSRNRNWFCSCLSSLSGLRSPNSGWAADAPLASVATWGISIVNELEDGACARSSIYYPAWQPNFAGTQIGYSIHNKRLDAVVNVRESALRDPAAACDFYLILKTGNKDAACK